MIKTILIVGFISFVIYLFHPLPKDEANSEAARIKREYEDEIGETDDNRS